ncbi:hypothetical protein [Actinomadura sp. 3N508]|uniref:hypothetical protein n=1 Tax=Actinomadura sp. 3N508 TaxID=3375153 RepID=UPI00379D2C36
MHFIDWLQNLTGIEWVQASSAIAGSSAPVFVLLALLQCENSRKNDEALIRERRTDFELGHHG